MSITFEGGQLVRIVLRFPTLLAVRDYGIGLKL